MQYKQYTLGELQNIFEKQQNPEELNKIMDAISDKYDALSYNNEETNNVQLEEEIYQHMNLIKIEDLNIVLLEEIKRKLDKKYRKMAVEDKINEIGEELDLGEIEKNMVNNVVPKPQEFSEPFGRNNYFIRPSTSQQDIQPIFLSSSSQGRLQPSKKSVLLQLVRHDTS